jgi:lysophospholipase L1-like esterase
VGGEPDRVGGDEGAGTMSAGCDRGVLALGDSITNGGGELQWGVALQSWALWTARALGLPFTSFAVDGARVGDVAGAQLAAARERVADPEATYDLGCLHIGANDVRALDWDADAYAADLATVLDFLAGRCRRVVVLTIPTDLGRPRAGARVEVANAVIEEAVGEMTARAAAPGAAAGAGEAARTGGAAGGSEATIVDLRGFRGRGVLMADHVHPTALGQVAIAERVVDALAVTGMRVLAHPRDLVVYEVTWTDRLRGDATYAYRHAKVSARSAWLRSRAAR